MRWPFPTASWPPIWYMVFWGVALEVLFVQYCLFWAWRGRL